MNEELLQKIYNGKPQLKERGITYDQFKKDMLSSDPALRTKVYEGAKLKEKGVAFEKFESDLGIGKQPTATATVAVAKPAYAPVNISANPYVGDERLDAHYQYQNPISAGKAGMQKEEKAVALINTDSDPLKAAMSIHVDLDKKLKNYGGDPDVALADFEKIGLNTYKENAQTIALRSKDRLNILHGEKYTPAQVDAITDAYTIALMRGDKKGAENLVKQHLDLLSDSNTKNLAQSTIKWMEADKLLEETGVRHPKYKEREDRIKAEQAEAEEKEDKGPGVTDILLGPLAAVNTPGFKQFLGRSLQNLTFSPALMSAGRNLVDFNPKSTEYQGPSIPYYKPVTVDGKKYSVVYGDKKGEHTLFIRDADSDKIIEPNQTTLKKINEEAAKTELRTGFNPKALVGQLEDVAYDMAPTIAISYLTGGLASSAGISVGTGRTAGVILGASLQSKGQLYKEMLQHPDLTASEAAWLSSGASLVVGSLETIGGLETRMVQGLLPKVLKRQTGRLINKEITKKQLKWEITKDLFNLMKGEAIEEHAQSGAEFGLKKGIDWMKDEGIGQFDNPNPLDNPNQLLETTMVAGLMGLLGGGGTLRNSRTNYIDAALNLGLEKPEVVDKFIADMETGANSKGDPAERQAGIDEVTRLKKRWESLKANTQSFRNLDPKKRAKLAALVMDSNALEAELSSTDNPAIKKIKTQEVEKVNEEISALIEGRPAPVDAAAAPGETQPPTDQTEDTTDDDGSDRDLVRDAVTGIAALQGDAAITPGYFEKEQKVSLKDGTEGEITHINLNKDETIHSVEVTDKGGNKQTILVSGKTPKETGITIIGSKKAEQPAADKDSKTADEPEVTVTTTEPKEDVSATIDDPQLAAEFKKEQTRITQKRDAALAQIDELATLDPEADVETLKKKVTDDYDKSMSSAQLSAGKNLIKKKREAEIKRIKKIYSDIKGDSAPSEARINKKYDDELAALEEKFNPKKKAPAKRAKKAPEPKKKEAPTVVETTETKPEEKKAPVTPMPTPVFHGGSFDNPEGIIYVTQDKRQAKAYAQGNGGKVKGFNVDTSTLAKEDEVRAVIKKMGLKPRADGWDIDELGLHELIDNRFETALPDKDIERLTDELKKSGKTGIIFTDEDILQERKEGVESIAVFDQASLTDPSNQEDEDETEDDVEDEAPAEEPTPEVEEAPAEETESEEFAFTDAKTAYARSKYGDFFLVKTPKDDDVVMIRFEDHFIPEKELVKKASDQTRYTPAQLDKRAKGSITLTPIEVQKGIGITAEERNIMQEYGYTDDQLSEFTKQDVLYILSHKMNFGRPIPKAEEKPKTKTEEKIKDIDSEIDDILNHFKKLGVAVTPEQQAEDSRLAVRLINLYLQKGYYTMKRIIEDMLTRMDVDTAERILPHVKRGYLAAQSDVDEDVLEKMDDSRTIRPMTAKEVADELEFNNILEPTEEETQTEDETEPETVTEEEAVDSTEEDGDTTAIINAAEVALSQAEVAKTPDQIIDALNAIEEAIESATSKLGKLTSQYNIEGIPHELPNKVIGDKIKRELVKFGKEITRLTGFPMQSAGNNLPPAGGDVWARFLIPGSQFQLHVSLQFEPQEVSPYDNYQLQNVLYRLDDMGKPGSNRYGINKRTKPPVTAKDLAQLFFAAAKPALANAGIKLEMPAALREEPTTPEPLFTNITENSPNLVEKSEENVTDNKPKPKPVRRPGEGGARLDRPHQEFQHELLYGTETERDTGDDSSTETGGILSDDRGAEGSVPTGGRRRNSEDAALPGTLPLEDTATPKDEATVRPTPNYRIPSNLPEQKSFNPKQRFKDNLAALKVLRDIIKDGDRNATAQEQDILARYVGWGALKVVTFDEANKWPASWEAFRPQVKELKEVVADLEGLGMKGLMRGIQGSIKNAHYTSQPVIRGMYSILHRLGFNGGKVMEPSAGIGNFFGTMPGLMAENSQLYAVELETLTGTILKKLYPNAISQIRGYQETNYPNNHFDMIISNIPFGDYDVVGVKKSESAIVKRASGRIHNFFFAKALDQVKEGGFIAFVTTAGVLDSRDNIFIREHLNNNADFLGAIRLPNTAFKGNAGTEVTTDIIFLRKNTTSPKNNPAFLKTVPITVNHKDSGKPVQLHVNEYFLSEPGSKNLLGTLAAGGLQATRMTVVADPDFDVEKAMQATEENFPKDVFTPHATEGSNVEEEFYPDEIDIEQDSYYQEPDGTYAVIRKDGKHAIAKTHIKKVPQYIILRDLLKEQYELETNSTSDELVEENRVKLNEAYDEFVKRFKPLNHRDNKSFVLGDTFGYNVSSLEIYEKGSNTPQKADILSKRIINPQIRAVSASSIDDAIAISINETGHVDLNRLADLLDKDPDEVFEEFYGTIFKDEHGNIVSRSEYLSGNVKKKLAQAKELAEKDLLYEKNVEALATVIPEDIPYPIIEVNIGARWVPTDIYEEFLSQLLGPDARVAIKYSPGTDTFAVTGNRTNVEARTTYGLTTADRGNLITAFDIMEDLLHGKDPMLYDTFKDFDGKEKRVLNIQNTEAAQEKARAIQDAFDAWKYADEERGSRMGKIYNNLYNTTVRRSFEGLKMQIPGMVDLNLRPHQDESIAMLAINNGGIIDHIVGAGKTFIMIAGGLKMKELRIANKPTIVALKSTIPDIVYDAKKHFPTAKILAPKESDFDSKNRKSLLSKIQNNDWDLIIMSHEQFKFIPQDPEFLEQTIQEEIDQLLIEVQEVIRMGGGQESSQIRSALEKRIEKLKKKLVKLQETGTKDTELLNFKEIGIDHIFVDESQQFKNLEFSTKLSRIAGLGNPTGSGRAFNMLTAIRTLQAMHGGDKGATFLSGTPISNSLVEMYLLLKYLRPTKMRELGYQTFDSWVTNSAERSKEVEYTVAGSAKPKTRFRKFINIPELSILYTEIADVRNDDNLPLPKPKVRGGEAQLVTVVQNDEQREFTERLQEFADQTHGQRDGALIGRPPLTKSQQDAAMLMVTNLSSKLAIDMRLINPRAEFNPNGKLAAVANNVFKEYEDGTPDRSTQLVFSDIGTPKTGKPIEDMRGYLADEKNVIDEDLELVFGPEEKPKRLTVRDMKKALIEKLEYTEEEVEEMMMESKLASSTAFNVYDEMKRLLVEKGIPASQIHFIHDYKTDRARKDLFQKVRDGDIRILLGSTQKLGTGVNVQHRLRALHHIDASWNPAAMAQRNGRGIRQKNMHSEVAIYNYATKGTLDAYKYQLIGAKQTFIDQVKTGATGERVYTEGEGEEMSPTLWSAIISENELLIESVRTKEKVERLRRAKKTHDAEQHSLKNNIASLERGIAYDKKTLEGKTADYEVVKNNSTINEEGRIVPNVIIDGKVPKDSEERNNWLREKEKYMRMKTPVGTKTIAGQAAGLNIVLTTQLVRSREQPQGTIDIDLRLEGQESYNTSPTNFANAINKIPKEIEDLKHSIKYSEERVAKYKEKIGKEWGKDEELREATIRMAEIDSELRAEEAIKRAEKDEREAARQDVIRREQSNPSFSIDETAAETADKAQRLKNPDPNAPILLHLKNYTGSDEDLMPKFASIWLDLIQKHHPDFYQRGLELIKGTPYEALAAGTPGGQSAELHRALSEAIAENAIKLKPTHKLIDWVKGFWQRVGKVLRLNIKAEDLQKLTIGEYMDIAAAQLRFSNEIFAALVADGAAPSDVQKPEGPSAETPKQKADRKKSVEQIFTDFIANNPATKKAVEKAADPGITQQQKAELDARDPNAIGEVFSDPKGDVAERLLQSYSGKKRQLVESLILLYPTLQRAGISVTFHEDSDSYYNSVIEHGGTESQAINSGGFYDGDEIHIHLAKPNLKANVAIHEALHPVIRDLLIKDEPAFQRFVNDILADPGLRQKYYADFGVKHYGHLDPQTVDEETLIEASADVVMERILRNLDNMPDTLFDRVMKYITDALGKTYGKLLKVLNTKSDFKAFANSLADAISKGKAIPIDNITRNELRTTTRGAMQAAMDPEDDVRNRLKGMLEYHLITNPDADFEAIGKQLVDNGHLTQAEIDDILRGWRNGREFKLNSDKTISSMLNMAELLHLRKMDATANRQIKNEKLKEFMAFADDKLEDLLDKFSSSSIKELVEEVAMDGSAHPVQVLGMLQEQNEAKRPVGRKDVIAISIAMNELEQSKKLYQDIVTKTGSPDAQEQLQYIDDMLFRIAHAATINGSETGAALGIRAKLLDLAGLTYQSQLVQLENINKNGLGIEVEEKHKEQLRVLVEEINILQDALNDAIKKANPKSKTKQAAETEFNRKVKSSLESRPKMTKEEALARLNKMLGVKASFSIALTTMPPSGPTYLDVINELVKIAHQDGAKGFKNVVDVVMSYDSRIKEDDIYKAILSTTPLAKEQALSEYARRQGLTRRHVKAIGTMERMIYKQATEFLRGESAPSESEINDVGKLLKEIEKNIYSLEMNSELKTQYLNAIDDIKRNYQMGFLHPTPNIDSQTILTNMINATRMINDQNFHEWLETTNKRMDDELALINAGRVSELVENEDKYHRSLPTKMIVPKLDADGNIMRDANGNVETEEVDYNFGKVDRMIQNKKKEIEAIKNKYRAKVHPLRFWFKKLRGTIGSSLAIADLSFIGIQGYRAMASIGTRHPKTFAKAVGQSVLVMFNEFKKNPSLGNNIHKTLLENPYYDRLAALGLEINAPDANVFVTEYLSSDDIFDDLYESAKGRKNAAAKVAKTGLGFRKKIKLASNASFSTYLNILALTAASSYIDNFKKANNGLMPSDEELELIIGDINNSVGRTTTARNFTRGAGKVFWAPRLYLSQILNLTNVVADPIMLARAVATGNKAETRAYLYRTSNSLRFAALATTLWFLRKALANWQCGENATYGSDSNKTDYLKIICGDFKFDPTGNHRQWLAFGMRLYNTLFNEGPTDIIGRAVATIDQAWQMVKYKFAPHLAFVNNLIFGTDFLGRKKVPGDELASRAAVLRDTFIPIYGQNLKSIVESADTGTEIKGRGLIALEALIGSGMNFISEVETEKWKELEKVESKKRKAAKNEKDKEIFREKYGIIPELEGEFVTPVEWGAIEPTNKRHLDETGTYKLFRYLKDTNDDGIENDYFVVKRHEKGEHKGKKYRAGGKKYRPK